MTQVLVIAVHAENRKELERVCIEKKLSLPKILDTTRIMLPSATSIDAFYI
jgi:hypothetical protein